jgi:hypothetical protein
MLNMLLSALVGAVVSMALTTGVAGRDVDDVACTANGGAPSSLSTTKLTDGTFNR